MSVLRRVAAGGVVLVLAGPLALVPAAGSAEETSGGSVVREVVVSTLEPTGKLKSTTVAQLIRLGPGDAVTGASGVSEYRNLSGFGLPEKRGGSYEWRSDKRKDAVTLAKVRKELPLAVDVSYFLNGKQMKPSALKGKSGVVRIVMKLENTTRDTRSVTFTSVNGEQATRDTLVYMPLELSVKADFPSAMWRDLKADGAYVQTDEEGTQIVVRPAYLSPPMGPRTDEVVFEARGENIVLPRIQVYAFPRAAPLAKDALKEQMETVKTLYGSMSSAYKTLATIYQGTLQLSAGLESLSKSLNTLDTKKPGLVEGLGLVAGGLDSLAKQLNTLDPKKPGLVEGLAQIKDGMTALVANLHTLDPSKPGLVDGMRQMRDGIGKQLLPAIGSTDPVTGRATPSQTTLLGGLQLMKDGMQGVEGQPTSGLMPATAALTQAIGAARAAALGVGDVTVVGIIDVAITPLVTGITTGHAQMLDGLGTMMKSLNTHDAKKPGLVEGLQQIYGGLELSLKGVGERDATTKEPVITLKDGVPTTAIGAVGFMRNALRDQVLPGVGSRDPKTGEPVITLKDGLPTTAIGALGFMEDAINKQILPGLGARDPKTGEPIVTLKDGVPTTAIGALGFMKKDGLDKVAQGLFAINELVVGGVRSGLLVAGDIAATDQAVIEMQGADLQDNTFLAAGADQSFTTYVFDLAGQSTTARDNAVRGGLIGIAALVAAVLGRRPRLAW